MRRFNQIWMGLLLTLSLMLTGCDEDTGTLGLYLDSDATSNTSEYFDILSCSELNNDVMANSTTSFLGCIVDPETDHTITASFAAQFHTFENYKFPERKLVPDLCDSIELRLFIRNVYGDKNNPMKMEVYELSRDNIMEETEIYSATTDLFANYVPVGQSPVMSKVITATDYVMTDAQLSSSTYSPNLRLILPREVGNKIMQAYYDNPASFADSYQFIRKVCPGFYFRIKSGIGTMMDIDICNLNLFFHYTKPGETKATDAQCTFSATPEVIQCTQFDNDEETLKELLGKANDYTLIKSPVGIRTELTLPVNDIYKGHENDTISMASLTLNRLNNSEEDAQGSYALNVPQSLLLVRKAYLKQFFQNHEVSDNQRSFTTNFEQTYNNYTFNNIGRLIAYCWREKQSEMKRLGMSEAAWEAANPDWNKVVLVPVTVSNSTDNYGNQTQVSVRQDLKLSSTKLVRGTASNPIRIQVIYSRFNEK